MNTLFYKYLNCFIYLELLKSATEAHSQTASTLTNQSIIFSQQKLFSYNIISREQIDINTLLKQSDNTYNSINTNYTFTIPLTTANQIRFTIYNSQTLSTKFRQAFNRIYTFKGYSYDRDYVIRMTVSPDNFWSSITRLSDATEWIIHPQTIASTSPFIIYKKIDDLSPNFSKCTTTDIETTDPLMKFENGSMKISDIGNGGIKEIPIAISCTKEFTAMLGSKNDAAFAIAQSMDYVSSAYERDFSIRFKIVTSTAHLFDLNDVNYPFSGVNSNEQAYIANNTYFNTALSGNEYDLAQVFTTIDGGVAYTPSACNNYYKGGSACGTSSYPNTWFLSTIAHEIGHQFSAGHTMSANTGTCGSQYMTLSSKEIGSGSTIMSYLGSCDGLNINNTNNRDFYFYGSSIKEIDREISFLDNTCNYEVIDNKENLFAPSISPQQTNWNIPINTPFKLEIQATDEDGDILTYAFDQNDHKPLGYSSYPDGSDFYGPLFKFIPPTTVNHRYFPALENLAEGNTGTYEILPQTERRIQILGVVRDNNMIGGRVSMQEYILNVQNPSCGAFEITNLKTPEHFIANGNNRFTITWNTAGCLNINTVKIKFSTDGGLTYPYTLIETTPNDGSESLIVPNLTTCDGRIMIEANDHIIFNINAAPITIINNNNHANGAAIAPEHNIICAPGDSTLLLDLYPLYGEALDLIHTSLNGDENIRPTIAIDNNNQCYSTNLVPTLITEIKPNNTDYFTFNSNNNFNISIYTAEPTQNSCEYLVATSAQIENNITQVVYPLTVELCKNKSYWITISPLDINTSLLNTPFEIEISATNGSRLYTGIPVPPPPYEYGYIVYNEANEILSIDSLADLSNASVYHNGNYTIKGISTNTPLRTLYSRYQNASLSHLMDDINVQMNHLDAQLSSNEKLITISSALDIQIWDFVAYWNALHETVLKWEITEDFNISQYIVERSFDGIHFDSLATIPSSRNRFWDNKASYQYLDTIHEHRFTDKIYYRIAIYTKTGQVIYTPIEILNNNLNHKSIEIYPNPLEEQNLSIHITDPHIGKINYQIFDMLGRTILIQTGKKTTKEHFEVINTTLLQNGIYNLVVERDGYKTAHIFIK